MYWNPAIPPIAAVSIEILKRNEYFRDNNDGILFYFMPRNPILHSAIAMYISLLKMIKCVSRFNALLAKEIGSIILKPLVYTEIEFTYQDGIRITSQIYVFLVYTINNWRGKTMIC